MVTICSGSGTRSHVKFGSVFALTPSWSNGGNNQADWCSCVNPSRLFKPPKPPSQCSLAFLSSLSLTNSCTRADTGNVFNSSRDHSSRGEFCVRVRWHATWYSHLNRVALPNGRHSRALPRRARHVFRTRGKPQKAVLHAKLCPIATGCLWFLVMCND